MACSRDDRDDHGHRRGAQREIVAPALDALARHRGAVARRQRDGASKHDGIDGKRAPWRPLDRLQERSGGEPHQGCRADAEHDALALRKRGIGERKNRHGSIRSHAADGACGDESRRMFQCQDDIGGAGGGRQGGDERGEEGPAALGGHRGDDDDRRSHRHLERKPIPKERIGEHRGNRRRITRG